MLKRLRQEDGMTLILAVGILAILTIVSTTMITYTSSSARQAGYHQSEDVAVDLAEAGLARVLSKLAEAPNALLPTLLSAETHTLDGGTVTTSGILAGETWNITSTSTVKNPSGAANLHKKLTMQVQIGTDPSANNAWNYVYSDAPSTRPCMTIPNSVEVKAPLLVRGNFCIANSAKATGSLIRIGGTVQNTGTSSSVGIGTSTERLGDVRIGGGCRVGTSGSFVTPCGDAQRVFVTNAGAFTSNAGTFEKPVVDWNFWYTNAKPGPNQPCTSGTGVPWSWDTNTTLDRPSRNIELMPNTAYSCSVWNGEHLLGRLSWTPDSPSDADDFGQLEISGTVFIDGSLDLSSGVKGAYVGRGSIYVSGRVTFGTQRQLCGVVGCDRDAWNPELNLLVFVVGQCTDGGNLPSCTEAGQNGVTGFSIGQSGIFQGATYVVSDFTSTSTGEMQGPIIAHQLNFSQTGVANKWVAIEAMTMGTPGGGRKLNILSTGF